MNKLSYVYLIASAIILVLITTINLYVGQVTIWTELRSALYGFYIIAQAVMFVSGAGFLVFRHQLELSKDTVRNFTISTVISGLYVLFVVWFLFEIRNGWH